MAAPKASSTAAATATAPVVVPSDVPCLKCGYNLRGLAASGLCPECAEPIARSLDVYRKLATMPQIVWARFVLAGLVAWIVYSFCCLVIVLLSASRSND